MKITQNPDGTFNVTFENVPSNPPYQLTLLLGIGALLAALPGMTGGGGGGPTGPTGPAAPMARR